MIEDEMVLLRQAKRLLESAGFHDRALKNTPATVRAEIYEELALRIEVRLIHGRSTAAPGEARPRTTEAMMRSATFGELYEAAQYLDELINVHGLANSFRIWDGKHHCVFAKE
ncbi:hypothetical protein D3C76_956420 [compost metagenome]